MKPAGTLSGGSLPMRLLLVEDSKRLQRTLASGLQREGYQVDVTGDGLEGLALARSVEYDLVVLDIMLPGMDGLSLLGRLRESGSKVHVLLLTARDTVAERVAGLNSGADDYLVKPFAFEELLARIASGLRRSYDQRQSSIRLGELEIDLTARRVNFAGRLLELRPREYAVLEYLALRRNQVVSREDIGQRISDDPLALSSNTVDSSICLLRRELQQAGCPELIHTRRGLGYLLAEEQS